MIKKLCADRKSDDTTDIGFIITTTKLYVPIVSLSINDNIIFL